MSMVRTMIAAAGVVLALGSTASAQVDPRTQRERNAFYLQQDVTRQNALAAQREWSAAQSRYQTQMTLRGLDEAGAPRPTEPTLRSTLPPAPPRGPSAEDMSSDMAAMERLTDQALAASNARLRAIKPAS
jgi:hypothetical protein